MRIALIAMIDAESEDSPVPRAFLRVGGTMLARHQLALFQALDCQRVICVARAMAPEVIALQHDAEADGMQFHLIPDTRALAGLVSASDDVFVLAEGLLVEPAVATSLLGAGPVVLVQPADPAVSEGFERIDLNHASAGAMRISGRFVDGLAQLPADCNVSSALTRLALQGGTGMREVPPDLLSGVRWRMIRSAKDAGTVERAWIRARISDRLTPTPGSEVARIGVNAFAPSLLHGGRASELAYVAALASLALALGLGWFELTAAGFGFCGLASFLGLGGAMLQRLEKAAGKLREDGGGLETAFGAILDLVLVALVIWHEPLQPWENMAERGFAPVVLVLTIRLVGQVFPRNIGAWSGDRAVLCVFLGLAAAFGALVPAVQIAAVLLALAGIGFSGTRTRITWD